MQRLPVQVRHPVAVLLLAAIAVAATVALSGSTENRLSSGGFEDPAAESSAVREVLDEDFKGARVDMVFLVAADDVDGEAATAVARQMTERLRTDRDVEQVISYWETGYPPLRGEGGRSGLVLASLVGDQDARIDAAGRLADLGEQVAADGVTVDVGGIAAIRDEINKTTKQDLIRAELAVFPLTLLLLVWVFRGLVAALLPLAVGLVAVLGTRAALLPVAIWTEVNVFALSFSTALGLGLAIDYALLVVSRFREELETNGPSIAAARTCRTAGRTVMFSAMTVAASLSALLVFRFPFLRSFAYAGMIVVGLAAAAATLGLPAALALLGRRVNSLQLQRRPRPGGWTRWGTIARRVVERPYVATVATTVLLVAMALPFTGISLGFPDDRVLPAAAETHITGDALRSDFSANESGTVQVLADASETQQEQVGDYAATLSSLSGAARVDSPAGVYVDGRRVAGLGPLAAGFVSDDGTRTRLSVSPSVEPISPAGEQLVRDIRGVAAPFQTMSGGLPAELLDGKAGLLGQLPVGLATIAVVIFVVLLLQFGSPLLPLKAMVLNLLSLTATFGAIVWVFQDGHLARWLGFTPTGTIVTTIPVLMFFLAFGLSMDYEVFLLSRIKEEHGATGDNEIAIIAGIDKTGRIITTAAVLMAVVFIAFSFGRVSFMKMFGVGMALAVLVDAFVVRATLTPALMALTGRANWWAPDWLDRVRSHLSLLEHPPTDSSPVPTSTRIPQETVT